MEGGGATRNRRWAGGLTRSLLGALGNASAVSVGFMVVVVLTNQLYQQEVMSK